MECFAAQPSPQPSMLAKVPTTIDLHRKEGVLLCFAVQVHDLVCQGVVRVERRSELLIVVVSCFKGVRSTDLEVGVPQLVHLFHFVSCWQPVVCHYN